MSKMSHLKALFRKNLTIQRRKCCSTVCEVIFPMILMGMVVMLRNAFKIEKYYYTNSTDETYFRENSTAITSQTSGFYEFTERKIFSICTEPEEGTKRSYIGIVGKNFPEEIKKKIKELIDKENAGLMFKEFQTTDEISDYIKSDYYGINNDEYPTLCFGIHYDYQENLKTYNISLHYFANRMGNGIKDIPSTLVESLDPFQNGPDMDSYERYLNSGYLRMMKILYDHILQTVTGKTTAEINFGVMATKYYMYQDDTFGRFIGFILPFFLVIAYLFPLSLNVSRMVSEKETKSKEGMKIMGLSETTYFLSYFLQYFITNTIYALINSIILLRVFKNIGYIYLFAFFWLYGMNVFGLAFFFQSVMDKTRLAMIVSILVYFIMYFVSIAVISEEVANVPKMFLSLFPPTALQLGINTLATFDSNGINFKNKHVSVKYNNYSVGNMYLMFFIDFFIYLFLGYYLQNIISHEFGISRPFYFLCTKKYWGCGKSNQKPKKIPAKMIDSALDATPANLNLQSKMEALNLNSCTASNEYFQNENLYQDRTDPKDALRIVGLRKEFSDGKVAVNGISFNLYKDEIFALLGHNGAGKSTTISMLSGLYEATSGEANYDGMNILTDANMDKFRSRLGICPQHDVLFEDLTVAEHLRMFCVFKGVSDPKRIESEIEKGLFDFNLVEQKDIVVKNLSAGQRRKLSIAIALIGGSEVIFLDEPSSGMDITSRRNLWDILKQCTKGKIIVLTTHYMEEASVLGKRIGIISNGNMKCIGTPLFLIEKFGKFISINVTKEAGASNEDIIAFFQEQVKVPGLQYETLSEEILFRIPKPNIENRINIKDLFQELDKNLGRLKLKSYGASMPTLEDVFLNVSSMERNNGKLEQSGESKVTVDNDKVLFDDSNYNVKREGCSKFSVDLTVSLKKRMLQIIRDKRSFLLEVLCPIILVLIGLAVSSVEFSKENKSFLVRPQEILEHQTIFYKELTNSNPSIIGEMKEKNSNITFTELPSDITAASKDSVLSFLNSLYEKNTTDDNYGSYLMVSSSAEEHKYEFVVFVNTQSRQSAIVYPQYIMENIILGATKEKINIEFYNIPMPKTKKEQSDGQERNNSTLVFFVAVAFALIPANFVTLIIKEREKNTKHLQIISGINLISYWFSNYIFELFKYYFTGGINLIIIKLFGFFPNYLYALYLLYGPSMVSFTYLFSFIFANESSAQNTVILLNFLFGALGSSVVLVLRLMEDLTNAGKGLSYILRIVPSFCFCYGYNELLSSYSLLYIDKPLTWYTLPESTMIKLDYAGMDCLYMAIETVLYLGLIVLFEKNQSISCCSSDAEDNSQQEGDEPRNPSNINDSQVMKEIDRTNDPSDDNNNKYAIKVKHLTKNYFKGCCGKSKKVAVNNISFCLEYGECFGFLGINGAGKTTTFKCITNEILASKGKILINSKDVQQHFHEVRSLIGYCPQFDAIFEYMTVYENLEFYAKIKGIVASKMEEVITALMTEMNLVQYKNKISGRLSGGNKRKLSVSIAMICNPPIVLLDEPSTGMDPEARRFMWSVIHKISTRSKHSSVIMTTHSMDEAETLCRRIGILVDGQFKCMGSSNYIKEKYGEGYEINMQIKPLTEASMDSILKKHNYDRSKEVEIKNIKSALASLGYENFMSEIEKGKDGIAYKLLRGVEQEQKISIVKLISWCHYIRSALDMITNVKKYFNVIVLSDYVDNSFLFKVHRTHQEGEKTIGFLFGLFEDLKNKCNIEEYSIQQTSLEQIFNKFASQEDGGVVEEKVDIEIKEDLLKNLLLLNNK